MESHKIDAYVVERINLESVLFYFSMKSQFLFWIKEQTKKSFRIRAEVCTNWVWIKARINVPLGTTNFSNLVKPQTDCPDLSRSNGKLKRKYKFDRDLLKDLKIKITGQDGSDCFGTAEIINSGKAKSDLDLFENAFHQSENIIQLVEEYNATVQDSDEWSDSSDSDSINSIK